MAIELAVELRSPALTDVTIGRLRESGDSTAKSTTSRTCKPREIQPLSPDDGKHDYSQNHRKRSGGGGGGGGGEVRSGSCLRVSEHVRRARGQVAGSAATAVNAMMRQILCAMYAHLSMWNMASTIARCLGARFGMVMGRKESRVGRGCSRRSRGLTPTDKRVPALFAATSSHLAAALPVLTGEHHEGG